MGGRVARKPLIGLVGTRHGIPQRGIVLPGEFGASGGALKGPSARQPSDFLEGTGASMNTEFGRRKAVEDHGADFVVVVPARDAHVRLGTEN